MTHDDEFRFTVTPYDEEPEFTVKSRQVSLGGSVATLLWLVAVVVAVAANFLPVLHFVFDGRLAEPSSPDLITVSYNGWGQPSYHNTNVLDSGEPLQSGARWAWVILAGAVLLILAAGWSVWSRRRMRLFGPDDLALAGVFVMAGSVAALVVSFGPDRHQLEAGNGSPTRLHWGWYWPVEAVAVVLGLLGWLWYRWQSSWVDVPEPPEVSEADPEQAYPQTENWFDETMDHPGTPTDLGPSPW